MTKEIECYAESSSVIRQGSPALVGLMIHSLFDIDLIVLYKPNHQTNGGTQHYGLLKGVKQIQYNVKHCLNAHL